MSAQAYKRWICEACGFIYDEAEGDPDSGLAPGTRYEDIPEDWACPLCGMAKSDLRLLPDAPVISESRPRPATTGKASKGGEDYVVIVGGGVAGWSVAEAIRRGDTGTPVLLITACKGLVYPKPAISIAISQGKSADDLVDKDGETRAAELDIELRPGVRVLKIDSAHKRLVTARGTISYGKLVLALGANQRQLPIDGDAADAVVSINDLASYRRFRESMDRDGMHITILGAGLIGCEFANDLVKAGHRVSVIDPADQPLSSLVPIELGEGLRARLAKEGVEWIFGETLKSVSHHADGFKAGLSGGRALDTDLVLSAAGLVPNVSLAKKSGLAVDRGISVNPDMLTSDPDIYALGDCASVEGKVYAFIEPIRRQATAIAESIAGRQAVFEQTPPLVRVKTSSMPICVSFVGDSAGQAWQKVGDQSSGLHFEAKQGEEITGFAVSDVLANNAGSLYQELTG